MYPHAVLQVLIADDAARLKNPSSKLFENLERQFRADFRLLLAAPHVLHNAHDLYSLLHFADDRRFGPSDVQRDAFVAKTVALNPSPAVAGADGNASSSDAKVAGGASLQVASASTASSVSARTPLALLPPPALPEEAAYVVRTRTSDVAGSVVGSSSVDIPAEARSKGTGGAQYSETIVDVELSLVQKHHYRAILEQHRPMLRKALAGLDGTSRTPLLDASKHAHADKGLGQLDKGMRSRGAGLHGLSRVLRRLRHLSSHPFLLRGAE